MPKHREGFLLAVLKSDGIRGAERMGFCKRSADVVAARNGIEFVRKKSTRDRREYLKTYMKSRTLTQYQSLRLRDKIHGSIALWLVKLDKPQSLQRIYSAMLVQFPDLKFVSLKQMIEWNVWRVYHRIPDGRISFSLPQFWPMWESDRAKDNKLSVKYPEMHAAICFYLERHGVNNPFPKHYAEIEARKRESEQKQAVHRVLPQLQMMAAATAIAKHHER